MITFSKFPNHGRLGNQLFQYAALMGLSNKLRTKLVLPAWEEAQYFEGDYPAGKLTTDAITINETRFRYDPEMVNMCNDYVGMGRNLDFFGYFQTEKYWEHCRPYVRNALSFRREFLDQLRRKYWKSFSSGKKVIAIHVRRGDYVGNENYVQLPIHYYITALYDYFPDWRTFNIIVFGDDIAYCKLHFDCLPNVAFAEGNSPIEDLALGTMCHHFIIPNSSFGWWMAYLGQKNGTHVVRPAQHFAGKLYQRNPLNDYYPEYWQKHWPAKIDLTDITFTIPVAYDHKDRKKNLDLCVCMLQHYFNTNIIIGEKGGNVFEYMAAHAKYVPFTGMKNFHRTRMLNDMAHMAETPFIANWDADVMVPPMQLLEAVERLRKGAAMVYPYNGQFARVPRELWFKQLEQTIDLGVVGTTKFNGMNNNDAESRGGAVMFSKKAFIAAGMENERFISFGPEDEERYHRCKLLGLNPQRTPGALYHINHWVGPDSSNRHPYVNQNRAEWKKELKMNATDMRLYVNSWPWLKTEKQVQPQRQ